METDKHVTIIRSRLELLLQELRSVAGQADTAAAVESLLLDLRGMESATAAPTGRTISLQDLRQQLTGMPGARHVLAAIDSALADGCD